MDRIGLARAGFLRIRFLLQRGGSEKAKVAEEIADALHNFPDVGNEFQMWYTRKFVSDLAVTYPDIDLRCFLDPTSSTAIKEPTLTPQNRENQVAFLRHLLEQHKDGLIDSDKAAFLLSHIIDSLDIGNYAEVIKLFEQGRKRFADTTQ